jgi:uncharacterized protein YjiS (DUF1127 family)
MINCQSDQPAFTTRGMLSSLARTLRLWRSRIRDRNAYPLLDERDLRDLRVSRWDVERELAKPFWRG